MRDFEANLNLWEIPTQPSLQGLSREQQNKIVNEFNSQLIVLFQKKNALFRNSIYPDMSALLAELKKRLQQRGILVLEPSFRVRPALDGNLAGPHPIQDAADYLESLARRLPD